MFYDLVAHILPLFQRPNEAIPVEGFFEVVVSGSTMQVLMKGHEQRSEHLCSVFPVDYTCYIIQFTVGQQKWEVRKRYSEFVKLYNLLESKFGFETIEKLPEIPPKKFLLALSPSLIKERQTAFADFLKEVVKNPGM